MPSDQALAFATADFLRHVETMVVPLIGFAVALLFLVAIFDLVLSRK